MPTGAGGGVSPRVGAGGGGVGNLARRRVLFDWLFAELDRNVDRRERAAICLETGTRGQTHHVHLPRDRAFIDLSGGWRAGGLGHGGDRRCAARDGIERAGYRWNRDHRQWGRSRSRLRGQGRNRRGWRRRLGGDPQGRRWLLRVRRELLVAQLHFVRSTNGSRGRRARSRLPCERAVQASAPPRRSGLSPGSGGCQRRAAGGHAVLQRSREADRPSVVRPSRAEGRGRDLFRPGCHPA